MCSVRPLTACPERCRARHGRPHGRQVVGACRQPQPVPACTPNHPSVIGHANSSHAWPQHEPQEAAMAGAPPSASASESTSSSGCRHLPLASTSRTACGGTSRRAARDKRKPATLQLASASPPRTAQTSLPLSPTQLTPGWLGSTCAVITGPRSGSRAYLRVHSRAVVSYVARSVTNFAISSWSTARALRGHWWTKWTVEPFWISDSLSSRSFSRTLPWNTRRQSSSGKLRCTLISQSKLPTLSQGEASTTMTGLLSILTITRMPVGLQWPTRGACSGRCRGRHSGSAMTDTIFCKVSRTKMPGLHAGSSDDSKVSTDCWPGVTKALRLQW
mmetsp:Transcript_87691/g.225958  ORF Transcript_87691/g.225958 Transcript_87691/m.225958 type:complete len:331 (-) Transcript_87691:285-1277(-)